MRLDISHHCQTLFQPFGSATSILICSIIFAYIHISKYRHTHKPYKSVNISVDNLREWLMVEYWTCISFSSCLPQDEVHQFCNNLVLMCSNIGMVYYTSLSRLNKLSFYFRLAQTFLWNLKVFNPRPFIEIEVVPLMD